MKWHRLMKLHRLMKWHRRKGNGYTFKLDNSVKMFISFQRGLLSEGNCAGKQIGSHKNYLPWQKLWKIYQVHPVPLRLQYQIPSGHMTFIQRRIIDVNETLYTRHVSTGFHITKTCLYNFDPLKPHFYIVKLGFTRVYIIFLITAQKHTVWVLVRTASPRRF